ncbi:GspH/FimT family pseudopilin [Shewanella sp. KX20019]|uniref:GspH/FimT family pseudopilin n=1 Tax=Shewanella sp. KX20019 TaxID=2803864 RepID=UPI0019260482|nr:GspH/FimT family pseudopilin [Shewanella sp. KX20019]QQX81512.1 GspH/FimT family pseudopilin [Shewanella sp. KX20019]
MIKRQTGFTLIELIVTLAISTILMAIAVPSFNSLYAYVRADINIRKIQQSIQLARNHAITYGMRVTVCPIESQRCSTDWQQNISVFTDTGQANTIDGSDRLIYSLGPFNPQDSILFNRAAIKFQPDGLAAGSNGTLKYCPDSSLGSYAKAIVINRSGRARFSSSNDINCSN